MDEKLIGLISGLLIMGYTVSGLFFFRFWKASSDRLFLFFGVAFWLLAFQRIVLLLAADEGALTLPYVIRLVAFVLILAAIVDKNRGSARQAHG